MRRQVLLGLLLATGAAGIWVGAVTAAQSNTARIDKLHDNLFLIRNGGGNTAAFITGTGVVLVDTKHPNWGQAILDQVRTVTDKPVTTIINTHAHGDHVGSNEFFPASVEIIAQENTKANMAGMRNFEGAKAQFLPDRTYKDKLTLLSGADRIDLYYFGPAHTNGDTIVVFPALRVAHTGDLFAREGAPSIDMAAGGSGVKYPDTLRKAANGIKDVDTVILGHRSITMPWSAFVEYAEFNAVFLAAVREQLRAGKTAGEAFAGLTLPEKFKKYDMEAAKDNVEKIYRELKP
jgi:glyoxylase-like metal-dependent hydrolase (beta-lactamase superfamily II)